MLLMLIALEAWLSDARPAVIEPPQFWAAIANNRDLDEATRRLAVIRLIDRHAKPGMTLTAFSRLLGSSNWLKKADFTNWNEAFLSGWIPLAIDRERSTTFCFRVFPDIPGDVEAVYFQVSGKMDVDTLWRLFRGEFPASSADPEVLEIATASGTASHPRYRWQKMKQRSTSTVTYPSTGH
jgi:hypothetical protein